MPALTVAYVGNFQRSFCTEVHVARSLEQLGHRVLRWQENAIGGWSFYARELRERGDIDMVLWTRTGWEWTQYGYSSHGVALDEQRRMLEVARAVGVPVVGFHLDRWWGLDRQVQIGVEPFFRVDLLVTADGGHDDEWKRARVNHRWLPPGVFGDEAQRIEQARPRLFPHDVVFVGTHPYPHREWAAVRADLLAAMRRAFGHRFAVYPSRKTRPIRGRQLGVLYATAKVVVGDSCLVGGADRYWSDRVPETLGRGGMLVHPHVDGIDEWYPTLPTFPVGDTSAAVNLVRELIAQPDASADRAAELRSLVLARDTYRHRMQSVLAMVGELPTGGRVQASVA